MTAKFFVSTTAKKVSLFSTFLNPTFTCSRYLFVLSNLVLTILGLILTIFGVWGLLDNQDINEILNFAANNKIINGSSMLIGVILIIVGLCGCLGSLYRKRAILGVYLTIVIIVVVIEVASIVFAIVKQDSVLVVLKEIWNGSSIEC